MNKIWFEVGNTRFEIDETRRFQMSKGSEYNSIKLDNIQIDKLLTFLQKIKNSNGL